MPFQSGLKQPDFMVPDEIKINPTADINTKLQNYHISKHSALILADELPIEMCAQIQAIKSFLKDAIFHPRHSTLVTAI